MLACDGGMVRNPRHSPSTRRQRTRRSRPRCRPVTTACWSAALEARPGWRRGGVRIAVIPRYSAAAGPRQPSFNAPTYRLTRGQNLDLDQSAAAAGMVGLSPARPKLGSPSGPFRLSSALFLRPRKFRRKFLPKLCKALTSPIYPVSPYDLSCWAPGAIQHRRL